MSPCRIEKSFVVGRQLGDKQYKNTKKIAE
jgi:hypothetical protein